MTTNAEMLKRAYEILPGNSLGSFYLPEGHEFVIERGAGSKVNAEPIPDYRSSLKADSRMIQQLGRGLLERGIMTNLAAKLYISLVHSDADIDRMLGAVEDTLRGLRARA